MEIQLVWYVKALQPGKAPRNDLAPSWSWMSINGAVYLQQIEVYQADCIKPLASVTEVNPGTEGHEPHGDGIGAHLRMRRSLNPVTLTGNLKSDAGRQRHRTREEGMGRFARSGCRRASFLRAAF